MAEKKVHVQKELQRARIAAGGQKFTWDEIVEYAIGGNDIDTQGILRKHLNITMTATLKVGGELLKRIRSAREAAVIALAKGQTKVAKPGKKSETIGLESQIQQADIFLEDQEQVPKGLDAWAGVKNNLLENDKKYQMGHTNFGVSTATTAIYLEANERSPLGKAPEQKKFRQELKALILTQQQVDSFSFEEWKNLGNPTTDDGSTLDKLLEESQKMAKKGLDITNDKKQIIDMAQGKADTTAVIEMELTKFNQFKKSLSQPLAKAVQNAWVSQTFGKIGGTLQKAVDSIPYIEGSKSIMDILTDQIIDMAVKGKSKKYTSKKNAKRNYKPKTSKKEFDKTRKKIQSLDKKIKREYKALGAVNIKHTGASQGTGSAQELGAILAMFNQKMPQTVAKNMGPPGLQNQTGRFASSVRVTDVSRTAQGHPSIGYTYQKNPYQVFEMSQGDGRWATPQRDPRKLIDASIREIAAQLALGRLYTRRM
jgi:hypothetical protein